MKTKREEKQQHKSQNKTNTRKGFYANMGKSLAEIRNRKPISRLKQNPTMFLSVEAGMRHTCEARPGGYAEGRGRGIAGSRPTRLGLSSVPVSATWWTLSQKQQVKRGLGL